MVNPTPAFIPILLKGMTVHPDDPLKFDFIVDSGDEDSDQDQIKEDSQRLIKYFLASLTVPKDDLWVNLSPYESDRVIPEELGKTELGRDLLALDYVLKQLTASLMYPEDELGNEFWEKIYKKAQEEYGTTEIPVNTFNKVWIIPEKASVYEHENTVYVVDSKLKVMLDSDYTALQNGIDSIETTDSTKDVQKLGENIVREIILPAIEKEVNEGEHFAKLRQIYHSLILAKWYKETIQGSILSQVYIDQNKVVGIENGDESVNDQIYDRYMKAFKKGVFNYIKEDVDRLSGEMIPRKYFSGGIPLARTLEVVNEEDGNYVVDSVIGKKITKVEVEIEPQGSREVSSHVDVVSNVKASLPILFNDFASIPTGFIGVLEEKDQVLSIRNGEIVDIVSEIVSSPVNEFKGDLTSEGKSRRSFLIRARDLLVFGATATCFGCGGPSPISFDVSGWSDEQLIRGLDDSLWAYQRNSARELFKRNHSEGIQLARDKLVWPRINSLTDPNGDLPSYSNEYKQLIELGQITVSPLKINLFNLSANDESRKWSVRLLGEAGTYASVFNTIVQVIENIGNQFMPWHDSVKK